MVLSLPSSGQLSHPLPVTEQSSLTNINNIPTSTRVETERRITCRTVLRINFSDVFIEASAVRNMPARQLERSFSRQSVFQWFFADGTLTANERPLSPSPTSICVQHP